MPARRRWWSQRRASRDIEPPVRIKVASEPLEPRVLLTLVHHYRFDEGSGSAAGDALGTNHGTLVNDPAVPVPPPAGGAGVSWRAAGPSPAGGAYLHFDSIPRAPSDDTFMNIGGRVDLAQPLAPDLGASGTIIAYMRIAQPGPEAIGNDTHWRAPGITGVEQAGGGNDIVFGTVGRNGSVGMTKGDGFISRSRPIADGTWHQVATVRDIAGALSVYIDGRLHSTGNSAGGAVTSFFNALGAIVDVAGDSTTIQGYNYLNNTDLDDVRIYNHAATAAEIAALLPGGSAPASPTVGTTAVDPSNGSLITLSFTDEAGFIAERSINGGTFAEVAQLGQSTAGGTITYTDVAPAFNQSIVYRVRAFNPAGESANAVFAPVVSGSTAAGFVSAGYFNSNFWGAAARVWPADNDPGDGATPGGGAENVGALSLDGFSRDPADPSGIAVRDPDVAALDPLTQFNSLSRDWGTGTPHPAIRADNFSTIYTGRITLPDLDGDGLIEPAVTGPVQFFGNTDDDGHLYVNGVLVSTDPGTHGPRYSIHIHPGLTLAEGQKVDFVMLQADQANPASIRVGYDLGRGVVDIPVAQLEAGPSVPQKSAITPVGSAWAHQVSFAITDHSTSEQRFELYRKPGGEPDSAYVKVNEAGINSPFINDASARPGASYTYVLRGYNFASGLGEASDPVTVTTVPKPPVVPNGLHAFYFNDDFWGRGGDTRPLPRHDLQGRMNNLYVGAGETINGADVHELVTSVDFDYGVDQHDPSIRPGGSPHPQVRDNSHSTVFTGKLVITEPGEYRLLGFGDDDTYVIVDGQVVSSDPFLHGIRDPRPSATNNGRPDLSDRFVRPINLTAGEHDLVVMQSGDSAGSGVRLRWIKPGQTTVETVPAANLNTYTPVPAAGTPTVSPGDSRGTNVLMSFARPLGARSELKTVLELATDAAFTTGYRKVVLGPGSQEFRLFGLTPNTNYFARATFMNFEGQSTSTVGSFNSSYDGGLFGPTNLRARVISPTQVRLDWADNDFDEDNFIVQRRVQGGTFADIATLPANTVTFFDTLDPVAFPIGTVVEYQVFAANAAGPSGSNTVAVNPYVPGGHGLRRRIWNNIDPVSREGVGEPLIDEVDPIVDDGYGEGQPHPDIGADTFAIEWVGQVIAEETKAYDFSVVGNDGIRLFLDDKPVIAGGWRDQPDTEYFSEPINLTAGTKLKVRLQMYDNTGAATARLRWNGPFGVREAIPTNFLFPTTQVNDEVANVPRRPVTFTNVFGLPAVQSENHPATIAIRWQDNAFGETGYEIQRATNSQFTQGLMTLSSGPGTDLFVDGGGQAQLDPSVTYYYRIRPAGASDWVVAGSARPVEPSDFFTDVSRFDSARSVTLNGYASTTAEGTLKLAHNQNDRFGSAYINHSFQVDQDFRLSYDQQIGSGNNADGMTFVFHNYLPPAAEGMPRTQLRALGGGGGNLGYAGIGNSVAIVFDFHDNIDQLGVWTDGRVPPGGNIAATRINDGSALEPNGSFDLRRPENGNVDLDNNRRFRIELFYDENGFDNGTPENPADDTGVLTVQMRDAGNNAVLNTSKWNVDLATHLDSEAGLVGWTAANGGLNERYEIYHFGTGHEPPPPQLSTVYVRGSTWTPAFKTLLETRGLGDDVYGYKVYDPTLPTPQNVNDILTWTNVDEVVVTFWATPSGSGIPQPGMVLDGVRQDYTVTTVTALDPQTYVLRLNTVLGGNPATAATNGDRVRLDIGQGGPAGGAFSMRFNFVQGDVNKSGSVLANDFSEVKARFFENTTLPRYSPFHDVDGSGSILANDFSAARTRFFHNLPAAPAAVATMVPALFGSRRVRPAVRAGLAELLT